MKEEAIGGLEQWKFQRTLRAALDLNPGLSNSNVGQEELRKAISGQLRGGNKVQGFQGVLSGFRVVGSPVSLIPGFQQVTVRITWCQRVSESLLEIFLGFSGPLGDFQWASWGCQWGQLQRNSEGFRLCGSCRGFPKTSVRFGGFQGASGVSGILNMLPRSCQRCSEVSLSGSFRQTRS